MFHLLFFWILFSGSLFSELPSPPPFVLVTIPKSGTHMILKCLRMMQTRQEKEIRINLGIPEWNFSHYPEGNDVLDQRIESLMDDGSYLLCHGDYSEAIKRLVDRYPEMPILVGIRDLRDALASEVFYQWSMIEGLIGPSSVEEKLLFLIRERRNLKLHPNLLSIHHHAKALLSLLDHPNTLVIPFEHLVGEEGGGKNHLQRQMIRKIAITIGVPISQERIDYIQRSLFGNKEISSKTFNSGQIGSWKKCFGLEAYFHFQQKFGPLQRRLGYST